MEENQPINNSLHLTFHIAGDIPGIGLFIFVPSESETGCLNDDNTSIESNCIVLYYLNANKSRIINYQLISDLYGWGRVTSRGGPVPTEPVNNRSYDEFKKANLMVNFLDVIKDGNGIIRPNDLSTLGMYNNDLIGRPREELNDAYIKSIRDEWERQLMHHAYNLGLLNHFSLDKVQGTSSHLTSVGPSADFLALDAGKPIGSPNGDTSFLSPLFSTWARWADPSSSGNAMTSHAGPHKYIHINKNRKNRKNNPVFPVFSGIDISTLSVTIDEKYYDAMGHGYTFKTHGAPGPYGLTGTNDQLWKDTEYSWKMDLFPGEQPRDDRAFATLSSDYRNTDSAQDMSIESFYGGNQEKANAWGNAKVDEKKKFIIVKLHGDGGQRDEVVIANLLMKKNNHDIAGCTCDNVHMCCLYGVNVGCIYTGQAKTMFPEVFKKQQHRQRVVQFTPEKDPVLSFFKEREYTLLKMCEHNYNICLQLKQIIYKFKTPEQGQLTSSVRVFLGKCQQQQKGSHERKIINIGGSLNYFKGMLYDCNIYILNILYELFGPDLFEQPDAEAQQRRNNAWMTGVSQMPSLASFDLDTFKNLCYGELDSILYRITDPSSHHHFSWLQTETSHWILDGIKIIQGPDMLHEAANVKTDWSQRIGDEFTIRSELTKARDNLIECKRLNYVTEVFFWDSIISTVIINGGAKFTPGTKSSFKPGMAHAFDLDQGVLKGSFQHIFQTKAGEIADDVWEGKWPIPPASGGGIQMGGATQFIPDEEFITFLSKFPPYHTPWGKNYEKFFDYLNNDEPYNYNNPLKFMYMKEFSVITDGNKIKWAPLNIARNDGDPNDNELIDLNSVILRYLDNLIIKYRERLNMKLNSHENGEHLPCWNYFSSDVVFKSLVDLYLAECYTNESQGIPGIPLVMAGDTEIEQELIEQLREEQNLWFDDFIEKLFVNEYYDDPEKIDRLNKQLREKQDSIYELENSIESARQIAREKNAMNIIESVDSGPPSSSGAINKTDRGRPSTPPGKTKEEGSDPQAERTMTTERVNSVLQEAQAGKASRNPLFVASSSSASSAPVSRGLPPKGIVYKHSTDTTGTPGGSKKKKTRRRKKKKKTKRRRSKNNTKTRSNRRKKRTKGKKRRKNRRS